MKFTGKKLSARTKKVLCFLALQVVMGVVFTTTVFASEPAIVTGAKNLATDATRWITILIPVVAGAYLGYLALQKSASDDQGHIAEVNKKMKNTIIGAVIGMSASGLVAFLLTYFK